MNVQKLITRHQVKFRHTLSYRMRYDKRSITINDQEEACLNPSRACYFAQLNIPGTDINKCQQSACRDASDAYFFARDILGADIEYCRKACEHNKFWLNEFDKTFF